MKLAKEAFIKFINLKKNPSQLFIFNWVPYIVFLLTLFPCAYQVR